MVFKFTMNDTAMPPGKVADAEVHFTEGPLAGLRLVGFSVWERRPGADRAVTFPGRSHPVHGERRYYALLRPIADGETAAADRFRDLLLAAFAEFDPQPPPATAPTEPDPPVSDADRSNDKRGRR